MNPCAKVLTGPLHLQNKTASDWGCQGFIAYGCYGYTVVVDPVTLQVIQTLGPHAGCVTHIRWSGEDHHHAFATGRTYSLHLAAADSTGTVVIWDVVTGQKRTEFSDKQPLKQVIGLEWYTGHDESHDLLMVLRSPDILELWDAFSGVRLWKKQFGERLLSFALDPFDIQRMILLCECPFLFVVTDVGVVKEPSDNYRCVQIADPLPVVPAAGSQRRSSSGSEKSLPRSSSSLTKMASLATNILIGPEQNRKRQSVTDEDADLLTSCKQVVFNPAHRHVVLLVFAVEIHMMDLDVDLTIGVIRLDRSSPNFVKVLPCKQVDMLFCLHDNGSASVRVRKQTNNPEKVQSKGMLDMTYDLMCQSDSLRLLRHSKVYSMLLHRVSEKQIALILSDSRVIFLDVLTTDFTKIKAQDNLCKGRPSLSMADMISNVTITSTHSNTGQVQGKVTLRMVMSGLVSGVISPVVALAPNPKADRSFIIAVGSGIGTIQLVNVQCGQVENEFKLFMSPVRGLLWITSYKLLAFSYTDPPSYGNKAVKSDILILDVMSGKVVPLCEGIDKKGPILKVTISATRMNCIVMFKHGHMELWNLKTRQMVREIVLAELIKATDVVWYPYITVIKKINKIVDSNGQEQKVEKKVFKEQIFISGQIYGGNPIMRLNLEDGILSGPFIFSSESLFEGQSPKAELVKLAWKERILVFADKGGQLFMKSNSNTEKSEKSVKCSDRQGSKVEDIKFAPGDKLRFFVYYTNIVEIWDICDGKPELLTCSPTLPSNLVHVCWAGPESIVMATEDSCLHVIDISRQAPTSPTENDKDDFFHIKDDKMKSKNSPVSKWKLSGVFSPALLEQKQAFLLKYSLQCNIKPVNEVVSKFYSLMDRLLSYMDHLESVRRSPGLQMETPCDHSRGHIFHLITVKLGQNVLSCKEIIKTDVLRCIRDGSNSTADRCYQVARLFGDSFDMKFWNLVRYASQGGTLDRTKLTDVEKPIDLLGWYSKLSMPTAETNNLISLDPFNDLDTSGSYGNQRSGGVMDISWLNSMDRERILTQSFGEMMKCSDIKTYESARLDLHNKKRFDYRVKQLCCSRYIRTNLVDMAVQALMETENDNPEFKSDYLKACLSSCTSQHTGTSLSTIKLAATHLIVAGQLSDGVDLLCLIGKHLDACKYLISSGEWQEAVWLAKTSLSERECLEIIYKWADHLWNTSQRSKATLLMLSHGQFATTLQMLCCQREFDTAALFLQSCLEQGLLEKSEHSGSVFVEFSKILTMTGYKSAVEHYCHLAGQKGDNFLLDTK